ncbi:galactokinase [Natronosporangium hydrolyticum]|uniref:Galactokinase n=1 Tax=Natronosporangium hydrolyticum TaxID=2811111 RepID=A0A895YC97_9ACTN|nr:galactokinase [Natronosporangium hydrolyticum]QSB15454.1 galactokinase [Natronosporangium hydrolyticum]
MTAANQFRNVFGQPPTGVWAAPGRVNLIGEHTDYNDGYVLPFALPLRTEVAAAPHDEPVWTVWSAHSGEMVEFGPAELEPGGVDGWAGYVAGAAWALREARYPLTGARLAIDSAVPVGAGLSSSAALTCAALTALADLAGASIPETDAPGLAQRAEADYVGMPCGIMDQTVAIRGQAGHALFLDCRTEQVSQVPLDLAAAGLAILVIDTRAPHRLVSGEYAARRATCEQAAVTLGVPALRDLTPADLPAASATLTDPVQRRRVRHVVTENQRVLDTVTALRAGQLREIGPLLSASHASLRDDFEVTVPELDLAAAAAEAAGAHGARMTGGGFGGCVLALVEADAADRVGAAVTDAFAGNGFTTPVTFTATPAAGATRLPAQP